MFADRLLMKGTKFVHEIRSRLIELEKVARSLEPDEAQRTKWLRETGAFANSFIDSLVDVRAFVGDRSPPTNHFFPDSRPHELSELLADLQANVVAMGLNPASGGHLGYIPGGGIFPTALGDFLAAVTNQYAGIFFAGPGAVRMEHDLIRWMCGLVGYPEGSLGNLTSGGSIANLVAFVAARDAMGITSERVRKSVIYLTQQVHHCVHKAIRIGGMSESIIRHVPMDSSFRMDARQLEQLVAADVAAGLVPFLIVASAGTTDTGAIDPLDAIAEIAERNRLWFHIDAAYGGFFILADLSNPDGTKLRDRFRGLARSDSVAIDPHKGLFLSYGVGAVLMKDVRALHDSHHYRANYMQDTVEAVDELNPADLSPELTKHFRGLRMWLPLQLFGMPPFVAALAEKVLLCRYFYGEVQKLGFDVGPTPELSVCIYRFVPSDGDANEFNLRLVEAIHSDGQVFVSSTTIDGVVWLRLAVLCFRTHLWHIDYLLELLGKLIAKK